MLHEEEKKFYFSNINVQGAVFAGNETVLSEIAKSCDITDTPTGSQCPEKAACGNPSSATKAFINTSLFSFFAFYGLIRLL